MGFFIEMGTQYGLKGGDQALLKKQQKFAELQTLARSHGMLAEDQVAPEPEGFGGFFMRLVDVISRPNYAAAGFFDTLAGGSERKGENAFGRAFREMFSGIAGLEGEKETFADVLEEVGFGEGGNLSDLIGENGFTKRFDPSTRGAVGLAMDIVFDPLTWISAPAKNAAVVMNAAGDTKYLTKAGRAALQDGMEKKLAKWRVDLNLGDDVSDAVVLDKISQSSAFAARNSEAANALRQSDRYRRMETAAALEREVGEELVERGGRELFEPEGLRFRIPGVLDAPVGLDKGLKRSAEVVGETLWKGVGRYELAQNVRKFGDELYESTHKVFNRLPLDANRSEAFKRVEAERFQKLNAASLVARLEADDLMAGVPRKLWDDRKLWRTFVEALESEDDQLVQNWFAMARQQGLADPEGFMKRWQDAFDKIGDAEVQAGLMRQDEYMALSGRYFHRVINHLDPETQKKLDQFYTGRRAVGVREASARIKREYEYWREFEAAMKEAGVSEKDLVLNPHTVAQERFKVHYGDLIETDFQERVASMFGLKRSQEFTTLYNTLKQVREADPETATGKVLAELGPDATDDDVLDALAKSGDLNEGQREIINELRERSTTFNDPDDARAAQWAAISKISREAPETEQIEILQEIIDEAAEGVAGIDRELMKKRAVQRFGRWRKTLRQAEIFDTVQYRKQAQSQISELRAARTTTRRTRAFLRTAGRRVVGQMKRGGTYWDEQLRIQQDAVKSVQQAIDDLAEQTGRKGAERELKALKEQLRKHKRIESRLKKAKQAAPRELRTDLAEQQRVLRAEKAELQAEITKLDSKLKKTKALHREMRPDDIQPKAQRWVQQTEEKLDMLRAERDDLAEIADDLKAESAARAGDIEDVVRGLRREWGRHARLVDRLTDEEAELRKLVRQRGIEEAFERADAEVVLEKFLDNVQAVRDAERQFFQELQSQVIRDMDGNTVAKLTKKLEGIERQLDELVEQRTQLNLHIDEARRLRDEVDFEFADLKDEIAELSGRRAEEMAVKGLAKQDKADMLKRLRERTPQTLKQMKAADDRLFEALPADVQASFLAAGLQRITNVRHFENFMRRYGKHMDRVGQTPEFQKVLRAMTNGRAKLTDQFGREYRTVTVNVSRHTGDRDAIERLVREDEVLQTELASLDETIARLEKTTGSSRKLKAAREQRREVRAALKSARDRMKAESGFERSMTVDLPKHIAEGLQKVNDQFVANDEVGKLLSWYDKLNNWFKLSVTRYFPAFHIRNAYSNVATSFMDIGLEAMDPRRTFEAIQIMRGAEGTLKIGGRQYTYKQLQQEMEAVGVLVDRNTVSELTGAKGGDVADHFIQKGLRSDGAREKLARGTSKVYGVTGEVENLARGLHYIALRKRGFTAQDASFQVNKFLFDYSNLSAVERGFFRRVFPFWTWFRKNAERQIRNLYERPGRVAMQIKVAAQDRGPDGDHLPHYTRGEMKLKMNSDEKGEVWLTGLDLPIANLNVLWAGSLGKTLREQMGLVTPFLKNWIELAAGKEFFSDNPIYGYGRVTRKLGAAMERNLSQEMKDWFGLENTGTEEDPRWEANRMKVYLVMKGLFVSRFVSEAANLDETLRALGSGDPVKGAGAAMKMLVGLDLREYDLEEKQERTLQNRIWRIENMLLEAGVMREFTKRYTPAEDEEPQSPASTGTGRIGFGSGALIGMAPGREAQRQ